MNHENKGSAITPFFADGKPALMNSIKDAL